MATKKISELSALTTPDGSEELVVNDSGTTKKIAIEDLFAGDNVKAKFGASDDLVIHHDTSNGSTIEHSGALDLLIKSDSDITLMDGSQTYMTASSSTGGVHLNHILGGMSTSEKLKTTSTGVDVTGTVTSDGLVVDSTSPTLILKDSDGAGTTASGSIKFNDSDNSTSAKIGYLSSSNSDFDIFQAENATITMWTNSTQSLTVGGNGDVRFFDTAGSATKFLWDSSAQETTVTALNNTATTYPLKIKNSAGSLTTGYGAYGMAMPAGSAYTMDINGDLIIDAVNVGIGTSSPTAKLDVVGSPSITTFTGATELGIVVKGSTGATDYSGMDFKGNSQANPIARIGALTTGMGSYLSFGTSNSYASGITNTAMTIDYTGNVLVGTTTSPSSTQGGLEIATNALGGGSTQLHNSCGTYTTTYNHLVLYNGNGIVGSISTNGSTTSYNTSSDYRLKEADVPMTGATERVKALRPINFAWKADGSRVDGFFAHELAEVVPEAATGTKDAMMDEEYEVTAATGDVFTAGVAEVTTESQVMETVETGSYVNLAGETIVETTEQGVTTELIETVVQRQDIDGVSTEVEVQVTTQVPTMETVITTEAVAEVIHSAAVEQPETLEEGQQWRETTAAVMGTRSVPDMQGIDQAKLVPLLTATIQELIARIEVLEA
jgi:hypothetical protein